MYLIVYLKSELMHIEKKNANLVSKSGAIN